MNWRDRLGIYIYKILTILAELFICFFSTCRFWIYDVKQSLFNLVTGRHAWHQHIETDCGCIRSLLILFRLVLYYDFSFANWPMLTAHFCLVVITLASHQTQTMIFLQWIVIIIIKVFRSGNLSLSQRASYDRDDKVWLDFHMTPITHLI